MPQEAPRTRHHRRPHRRRSLPDRHPAARDREAKLRLAAALGLALLLAGGCATGGPARPHYPPAQLAPFRAPAVPLFVQTPYLNVWLFGDRLADDAPKLWNGQTKGMAGMVKIDGKPYRFLGLPGSPLPAMRQDAVRIFPTRTEFLFSQGDVALKLEFLSPLDPRDLELLSMPLGLVRAEITTGAPRAVQLYLDITGEWAVGSSDRRITWDGSFRVRPSQPRLFRETNNYPDWGEVHWAAVEPASSLYGPDRDVRKSFVSGVAPPRDTRYPRPANEDWPVFAHAFDLGTVNGTAVRRAVLAHVRREAVNFFGTACPSAWTAHWDDGAAMVAFAARSFDSLRAKLAAVDAEILARARAAGGEPLAQLCALAYRQAMAANEPAIHRNETFLFSKSMDIAGTSYVQSLDVILPAAPLFLALNPSLLRMQLAPVFEALRRGDWKERHAMHDLGLYPNATGPLQGGDTLRESSARLILLAALAAKDDRAGITDWRPALLKMAQALAEEPPGAELALASLPEHRSQADERFKRRAPPGRLDPDIFLDRALGLRLFSDADVAREVAGCRARAGKYGTPFEPGRPAARADALLWIAAVAPRAEREAIAAEVLRFYAETPARIPAADRYESDTGKPSGTQARPVVGSFFAPLLLAPPAGR